MRRMTIEEIREYIKNNSKCSLINADNYKSSRNSIIKIKCECGAEFETTLKIFQQGKRQCNKCTNNNIMYKNCKYAIDDIVNTKNGKIKILDFAYLKNDKKSNCRGYKYECLIDGYIGEIREKDLDRGRGCTVCGNNKVVKGINDISTTHSELLIYFKNIEDAYNNSAYSNKSIFIKCPSCGYEKKIRIADLSRQGFGCFVCNDGISIGEKIMSNVLLQLNIKFHREKSDFEWLKPYNKRYDFYFKINNEEYIIETHGKQHYKETTGNWKRTLKEEIDNDNLKKELAINNGIKKENYIVVNCEESNLKWIKNSIISELNNIFPLNKINWIECYKNSCVSNVFIASDLYNKKWKIKEISKKLNCGLDTVRTYLQKGMEMNIVNTKEKNN